MTAKEENLMVMLDVALQHFNSAELLNYSEKVLEINSKNAKAWVMKGYGIAIGAIGENVLLCYKNSMLCIDTAVQCDPDIEITENNPRLKIENILIRFLCQLGNYWWEDYLSSNRTFIHSSRVAVNWYEQALIINPNEKDALESVIIIMTELGEIEQARYYINRIKKISPNYKKPQRDWVEYVEIILAFFCFVLFIAVILK